MELTAAEVSHLLKLPDVARALAVYNRVRSASPGLTVDAAVELQRRAREFDRIERTRKHPNMATMGF